MGGSSSKKHKSTKKANSTETNGTAQQQQTNQQLEQQTTLKVETLTERLQLLGEAPHWDERSQVLYFVSVLENSIHKFDPATGVHTSATLDGRPGFIIPLEDHPDQFVVGLERKFVTVQWDGTDTPARILREICEVDRHAIGNRLNDGKADPKGRLYAGTLGYMDAQLNVDQNAGALFRLDGGGATTLADQVSISNGMAWDLHAKAFYYIDSLERKIRKYDYNVDTGDISNQQYIFDLEDHNQEGIPDGCTIDSTGNLWVAVFNGGCVLNISPTGELLRKIEVPAKQVTSCTFGGAALNTLFVTTGRLDLSADPRHPAPPAAPAGAVFKVTGLGVTGRTNNRVKENVDIKNMASLEAVTKPVWLGEGPHWDHREQVLYFVSIFDKSIHRYDPDTGKHTWSTLDDMPGFVIPIEGKPNRFVVGLKRKIVEVDWNGLDGGAKEVRTIAEVDQDNPGNRFNDAKADPRGRLFAGTMGEEYEPGKFHLKKGKLYRLDHDGSVHTVAQDIDISNGLCWDLEEKAFYYADSFEYDVRRYDYDVETGEISNPRFVFNYAKHGLEGIVDGMTIDTDGNLWIANFDGHQVLKVDPRKGKLLQKYRIPALQVTSCTFGGPNYEDLYVTSAAMDRGAPQPAPCGATFRLQGLGVRGRENVNVKLD